MSFVARTPSAVNTTFTFTTGAAEANLYDGNDSTAAADSSGLTASTKAAYDLGAAYQIERCRVITAPVNAWGTTVNFNIDYSDTSLTAGFTTATTIQVTAGLSQVTVKTFDPVGTHRYWRIASPSGTGGNAWLGELTFYTQLLDPTSYSETGNAVAFSVTTSASTSSFSVAGVAALFTAKLAAVTNAYLVTGNAAAFRSTFLVSASSYAVAGIAAPLMPKLNSGTGAFTLTGYAIAALQTWGVAAGSYLISGVDASLTRDYVNWVQEGGPTSTWAQESAPATTWTVKSAPSSTWTNDPDQFIGTPVSH